MDKNILNIEHVFLDVQVESQKEAFKLIAKQFYEKGYATDEKKAYKGLIKREKEGSTGFNEGIAIPHAKIKEIIKPGVFIFQFANHLEWDSIDNSKVQIAIALAIPENDANRDHLKILSSIARKLIDDDFRAQLKIQVSREKLFELVSQVEII